MKNKKRWDVLTLSGNFEDIEILSSYIYDQSLGSYIKEDKQLYYFDREKRDVVNDILENHMDRFDINFCWGVQKDENWHLNWQNNFTPIRLNDELIIIPNWDENIYSSNKVVKIKPGMAFGTGHHETTFLMLKYLIKNVKKGSSVLDLGSGSGILSIVSKVYEAKKITAVEFDPLCKSNFLENLFINNIESNEISLIIEDILELDNFKYDIILANINKNIIKELISKLKDSKARIFLSGILTENKLEILSLCEKYNMQVISEDYYNEWLLLEIKND